MWHRRQCDICGEYEADERRSTGYALDVYECTDGLMRCDVCIEEYEDDD